MKPTEGFLGLDVEGDGFSLEPRPDPFVSLTDHVPVMEKPFSVAFGIGQLRRHLPIFHVGPVVNGRFVV